MKSLTFPFGKYKGQPLEAALEDKEYIEWLINQSWFLEKHKSIHTLIINNFQEPSDTPEHNILQALFLDKHFIEKFLYLYFSVFARLRNMKDFNSAYKPLIDNLVIGKCDFEVAGYDVIVYCKIEYDGEKHGFVLEELKPDRNSIPIEIKSSVGDDYPSILRKIHAMKVKALFLEHYKGKGVPKDTFVKIFESQRIPVIFKDQIVSSDDATGSI